MQFYSSLCVWNTWKASLLHVNLLCQITLLPSAPSIYTPVFLGPREGNHHSVCSAKFTKCPDCVSHNVNPLTVNRHCCHGTYNHPLPAFCLCSSPGDLLPGFSLLFCLFACSTFHTNVCICNNKQMISFSLYSCSCRPSPGLQHGSLTHSTLLPRSFNRYNVLKFRRVEPGLKVHPETIWLYIHCLNTSRQTVAQLCDLKWKKSSMSSWLYDFISDRCYNWNSWLINCLTFPSLFFISSDNKLSISGFLMVGRTKRALL